MVMMIVIISITIVFLPAAQLPREGGRARGVQPGGALPGID